MTEPWQLEGFAECVARWRADRSPSAELVRDVLSWLLTSLKLRPFDPPALPVAELGITFWFVQVPLYAADGCRIVCTFRVDVAAHALHCLTLEEIRQPI